MRARKRCTALCAGAAALWRVSARARFSERAGARPVAHTCSERPHAPPTARMRERVQALARAPSPPPPLDPSSFLWQGLLRWCCSSKYAIAGVAALDPRPRPTPPAAKPAEATAVGVALPPAAGGHAPPLQPPQGPPPGQAGKLHFFSEIFLRNEFFLENLRKFLSQIDFS